MSVSELPVLMSSESQNKSFVEGEMFRSGDVRWKENLARKASEAFFRRQKANPNLADFVYNNNANGEMSQMFVGFYVYFYISLFHF